MAAIERRPNRHGTISWRVRWTDSTGVRQSKRFDFQRDAKAYKALVEGGIISGGHLTLQQLIDRFLIDAEAHKRDGTLEWSTVRQYRQHIAHIARSAGFAGSKVRDLTPPRIHSLITELRAAGMSPSMISKVRQTLSTICNYGVLTGHLPANPVRAVRFRTSKRDLNKARARKAQKLQLPTMEQVRALVAVADQRARSDKGYAAAIIRLLIYCGLRISEARGLPLDAVHLEGSPPRVRIYQRADQRGVIGPCKTIHSEREIPLSPATRQALHTWLASRPQPNAPLLFPNSRGKAESYSNWHARFWKPLCLDAHFRRDHAVVDDEASRYTPHLLRHLFATALISRNADVRTVMALMGHGDIRTTLGTYGHLWRGTIDDLQVVEKMEAIFEPNADAE